MSLAQVSCLRWSPRQKLWRFINLNVADPNVSSRLKWHNPVVSVTGGWKRLWTVCVWVWSPIIDRWRFLHSQQLVQCRFSTCLCGILCGDAGCSSLSETVKVTCSIWVLGSEDRLQIPEATKSCSPVYSKLGESVFIDVECITCPDPNKTKFNTALPLALRNSNGQCEADTMKGWMDGWIR